MVDIDILNVDLINPKLSSGEDVLEIKKFLRKIVNSSFTKLHFYYIPNDKIVIHDTDGNPSDPLFIDYLNAIEKSVYGSLFDLR